MIRVLLCDDHLIVRQGLRQLIADAEDISVTAEAQDGITAIGLARKQSFEVVLLDIAMPNKDGLDVLKQLRHEFPKLPVLMLSTYPEKQYAVRCLKLCANGYLNKSTNPAELAQAIRKVAAGGIYVNPAMAETLAMALANPENKLPHEDLSHREYQVFCQIAAGQSLTQIAEKLSLSLNTISTYRARILSKTHTKNDVEIALYAVKNALQASINAVT